MSDVINDLKENDESVSKETENGSELQRLKLYPESHLNEEIIAGIASSHVKNKISHGIDEAEEATETTLDKVPALPKHNDPNKKTEIAVEVAKVANATFKYFGKSLTFAVIAIDAYRMGASIHDDILIRENAPAILKEIEEILECLHKKKDEVNEQHEQQEISELIVYYTKLKKEVKLIEKQVPCRTIKAGASIGGSWLVGAAGAAGGGWAGFHAGAVLGTFFGPVGTAMGGIVGGIIGSVGVGIASGIAGSHTGRFAAERGLEITHDVLYSE